MDETDMLVEAISGMGSTISDEDQAYQIQLQEALYASSSSSSSSMSHSILMEPEVCTICMESNQSSNELIKLQCSHIMCIPCLTTYIKTKVEERVQGGHIVCVVPGCGQHLEPNIYGSMLPMQLREAWEQVLAEDQIPQGQRVYCPFPDCSALLIKGDEEKEKEGGKLLSHMSVVDSYKKKMVAKKKKQDSVVNVECPCCHRLFCLACMVPWHANLTCLHFQANLTDPHRNPSLYGSTREDLLLRTLAKEKKWMTCSNCKHIIELNHGCMHITCRCGNEFCYKCGEKWTSNSHICRNKKHG